jgi:hypothetical protein
MAFLKQFYDGGVENLALGLPLLVSQPNSVPLQGILTDVLLIRSEVINQRASYPVKIIWVSGFSTKPLQYLYVVAACCVS